MAKVEGILEQVGERLNALDTRLNHLETRMDGLETRMDGLGTRMESGFSDMRREMHSQFRWTMGIMLGVLIPMWVTIILTILFQIP